MKKLAIAGAILLSTTATAAYAETTTNAVVTDHYRTVTRSIPYTEQICRNVDVPIYGKKGGGASAGDVLGGMIIGGLLGKGATGKDDGAAAGAVIGGMIAADKKHGQETIIGYRQETRCENKTTYSTRSEEVYDYSTITFKDDGRRYVIRFQR